ncbi:hypothetical protein G7Z17_g1031 [Cylindrodendrum hubeiense]|uniref:FAD/NAD(P)-binding domain-containing protein n=1 Tax=Cylindrodendrum hubeiense TaxID=595255 RepID=A0A9P5LFQ4_9HYPO|nr:hypothetical protein G7Z17_g1031 [Cylindrodendrum hubeiense]
MPSYDEDQRLDAIIIGAGFGGCYLLQNLRKQGFRVKVVEEANGIGGVWWHNRYPGARVDTNVPYYEFSDPDLWGEWEWKEEFPSQQELLDYFQFVDKKWDLSKDIIFGTKVSEAVFDAEANEWVVWTDDERVASARFLLPAMGFAAKEYVPDLKGLETFQGFLCHTAKWPRTPTDLSGKRVGVIGSGATGVQIIQELGPIAGQLVAFQRSHNCALPMRQKPLLNGRPNKADHPEMFKQMKLSQAGFNFKVITKKTIDDTPEERTALYEDLWEQGGFAPTYGNYADFTTDIEANRLFYNFWRDKVRQRIVKDDPELIENLAPWDPPYPFGTKRPSLEQAYYEVFNQDNVRLVSLKKNPIDEVIPNGVRLQDGTVIELDALILATGFDAVTGSFSRVKFTGMKNRSLNDEWKLGSRTYLGMSTSGFPNMFYLYGPQSPTSWAVGPVISEIQCDWIIQTMIHMRTQGLSRIETRLDEEKEWARLTNEACNKTLLPLNETTWYMGGNIPGKARQALNYMEGLPAYRKHLGQCETSGWANFIVQ